MAETSWTKHSELFQHLAYLPLPQNRLDYHIQMIFEFKFELCKQVQKTKKDQQDSAQKAFSRYIYH